MTVRKTVQLNFKTIEDGTIDWPILRQNFKDVEDTINEHANELAALSKHQTFTVSAMFESAGKHLLMNGGAHVRCKPISGFVILHDNIENEIHVNVSDLSGDVKFSSTEKKGAGKVIELYKNKIIHFVDAVYVELTADRRISVYLTFESVEEA